MPFFIKNHTVTPGNGVTLIPIDMVVGGTFLPFKSVFPKTGVWCCKWAQWVLVAKGTLLDHLFSPPVPLLDLCQTALGFYKTTCAISWG